MPKLGITFGTELLKLYASEQKTPPKKLDGTARYRVGGTPPPSTPVRHGERPPPAPPPRPRELALPPRELALLGRLPAHAPAIPSRPLREPPGACASSGSQAMSQRELHDSVTSSQQENVMVEPALSQQDNVIVEPAPPQQPIDREGENDADDRRHEARGEGYEPTPEPTPDGARPGFVEELEVMVENIETGVSARLWPEEWYQVSCLLETPEDKLCYILKEMGAALARKVKVSSRAWAYVFAQTESSRWPREIL